MWIYYLSFWLEIATFQEWQWDFQFQNYGRM